MNLPTDLRAAGRRLLRAPGSSAALIAVLALGIGANSAIFGVVDALLFRALPVADPERLVRFQMSEERGGGMSGGVSFPQFEEFRADLVRERLLEGLAAFANGAALDLSVGTGEPERISGAAVSGEFFSVLGIVPQHGRLLLPADDSATGAGPAGAAGAEPVAVLSDGLWRRAFGADPAVVGTKVLLNRHDFRVVGVAPPRFRGPTFEDAPDLWVSLGQATIAMPDIVQFKPFERRGFGWLEVIGRLTPEADTAQLQARLDVLGQRSADLGRGEKGGDPFPWAGAVPAAAATLSGERRATVDRLSWLLLGVAGLVLLVACSVAAGLLLVRGERRQRELAIRQAIGASSGRVARELLCESALVAAASAVVGGGLAALGLRAFARLGPSEFVLSIAPPSPASDPRMLAFTAAVTLAAALLFGVLPALRGGRATLAPALKGEARRLSGAPGRGRGLSLRDGFVIIQVALSALLLVGAGLFLRTLSRASEVDLGFDADRAVAVQLDVSRQGYSKEAGRQFYGRLLERVRGLPGVSAAATAYHVPVQEANALTSVELTNVTPEAGDPANAPRVAFSMVSQGFFAALGVAIERGRDFDAAESSNDGAPVVIVNRAFAERFWPGLDPLAQRVLNFGDGGAAVIGVVPTLRNTGVREADVPFLYVPSGQFYTARRNLVVRTEGDPRTLMPMLRAAIQEMDPHLPQIGLRTLRERAGLALAQERVLAGLLTSFGALALALAALGVYSVMAYAAEVRTHEFGVRLALGAEPSSLLRMVLRRVLLLVGLGLVAGLAAALAAARSIASLLYGVPSTDGVTFAAIAFLLTLVGLAASALPALRAANLDPMTVLRQE